MTGTSGTPKRGATFKDEASGSDNMFVRTGSSSIYQSQNEGDTWTDVSPAGTAMGIDTQFIGFGGDVIAVSSSRAPISKDLSAAIGTVFTDLAGSPPTAFYGARVRQHVVLAKLSTDHYAVRWGAIGAHTDWPTPGTADARSKEAGTQSLDPKYGLVSGIAGGEKFGLIFQTSGITRMTYVGGSIAYEFDTFEQAHGLGTVIEGTSVVPVGNLFYWLSNEGVFATDGYSVNKISTPIEQAMFVDTLDDDDAIGAVAFTLAIGAYEPKRKSVIWAMRRGTSTDFQLLYDTEQGRFFALRHADVQTVFSGHWNNQRKLYNIAPDHLLQTFTATAPAVELQTGFIEIEPGYRVQLHGAHLLGTGVPGSLTLSYKGESDYDNLSIATSGFTALTAASRGNRATGRDNEQFFSFRITGTGSEAQLIRGIRIFYERGELA